jgi:heme exporter protein B
MRAVLTLIHKEFLIDWRDKQAWSSIALYVLATVYVVYLAFQKIIEPEVWNALLWIILLFTGFNVVSRTYDQDRDGRALYLYTLASAQQVILAKTLYSGLFMLVVGLFTAMIFGFFLPFPTSNTPEPLLFTSAIMLGSLGITSTLGLISAIAWKTGANSGMIAILGFPVVIPLLMAIIRYSEGIISGFSWSLLDVYAFALALLILLGTALGYILFPYIWRE